MRQEIKALAEKRQKWVEANRENGFEVGLKRLLTDLYPDNAHFIYELLQNAEDAHAQEVRFILHEDRIEFEHNGERLFSIEDVDAITSIGFSTKRDDVTSIGKFGVGFKAVFAYTETPKVESGEFNFKIRDMVVPEPDGLSRSQSGDKQTRFILPFDNPKKSPEQARSEIERLIKALGATTLLFLTYIRKIEYLLPDSSLGYTERIGLDDNRFEIRVQHPHGLAPSSTWFMKFDKEVQVEDEEAENESQKVKSCRIAVAFELSPVEAKAGAKEKKAGGADAASEWELAPMKPGRVCIYFPADKETSNLRFHLHAPFASTVARDSVRDCAGNNVLRNHLADLLAESMHSVRDQGLLTVHALSVLPNDKDNLSEFYLPLMNRLVEEFREKNLVPMKRGGHAAASDIFKGPKPLSDLVDDDDMVTLLGDDYVPPMWVANPPQRNQREDNFLSMLGIEQWDDAELVKALASLDKGALGQWMGSKDEKWHQILYERLMDFIKAPNTAAANKIKIKGLDLVRCRDDIYRKGSECFFPTEGVEQDDKFPRVAKGVYFADKEENEKARKFLETVGVREVDEKTEIEYILKERYSQEAADKKQLNDMARFIVFAEKHPNEINLFQFHYIFKLESGNWGKPNQVYLDLPFMDTGLSAYYKLPKVQGVKYPLSSAYENSDINLKKLSNFCWVLDVACKISLTKRRTPWGFAGANQRETDSRIDEDYELPECLVDSEHFKCPDKGVAVASLIWKTMKNVPDCQLYGKYRPNQTYSVKEKPSIAILSLQNLAWVPQQNSVKIEFVQPCDAVAAKLPGDFEFQENWEWVKALEFGLGVKERLEAQRREKEHQSQEYKRKEQVSMELGFESPEEAEEIAKLKKENPEEFSKFKESILTRKERPTFPTKPVDNPERRQERRGEQLTDAPNKEYEKRERSVRTTNGAIDPITWLRNQYTNEDDLLVCQICKEEMPFRKRDRAHYFEKKEVLSRKYLPKEHEAQYLALCPLCAAMYEEFVKSDDDAMADLKDKLVSTEDCDVPITLGDQKTSIRFVETHYLDIKNILEEMG